ncbi:MAG TPA: trypsin-like peptidase domain-containing protein [Candidatus Polarisedimenticolia bacterium]|nr:trypsin-like peptidase domain-containing protein [Candidatus Polarisedimenticolia bacterium]
MLSAASAASSFAVVCSTDDRRQIYDCCQSSVNRPEAWRAGQSVAKLVFKDSAGVQYSGTGFLVGDKHYLLTNNHVIAGPTECSTLDAFFNYEVDNNNSPRSTTKGKCARIVCQHASLDYSLIELTSALELTFGSLSLAGGAPSAPSYVIPQHPAGGYKKVHLDCAVSSSTATTSEHQCDTQPGSSGSPLVSSGSQSEVHALHRASTAGACPNLATTTASIVADLTSQCGVVSLGAALAHPACPALSKKKSCSCASESRFGYEPMTVPFSGSLAAVPGSPLAVLTAPEDIRDLMPRDLILDPNSIALAGTITDERGPHPYSLPPRLPVEARLAVQIIIPADAPRPPEVPDGELSYRIVGGAGTVGSFALPEWVRLGELSYGGQTTGLNRIRLDLDELSAVTLSGSSGVVSMSGDVRGFVTNDLFQADCLRFIATFTGTYDFDTGTARIASMSVDGEVTMAIPALSSMALAILIVGLAAAFALSSWRRARGMET